MSACYDVGVRMAVKVCVSLWVFYVCDRTREAVKNTIRWASWVAMANHSQPESESASASASETEPQMFGCSGWVGGWKSMWVGWLLVVDSSPWSLALLLPLQMTTRRRSANIMERRGEARLCRLVRGRIALEWFLLWQAHAVRQIKWPSHNNNNNNNNNYNKNNKNKNESWQAIKCCMLQMWPKRADRNREKLVIAPEFYYGSSWTTATTTTITIYMCMCVCLRINPARTSLWRNSIDSAQYMKLSFSVRY